LLKVNAQSPLGFPSGDGFSLYEFGHSRGPPERRKRNLDLPLNPAPRRRAGAQAAFSIAVPQIALFVATSLN
jgi:hypothetical protein